MQKNTDKKTPIIIHSGTNNLGKESLHRTLDRLDRLGYNLVFHNYKKVVISGVVYRAAYRQHDITAINNKLAMLCARNDWIYIDHDDIDESCLSSDGVHINCVISISVKQWGRIVCHRLF